MQDFRKTEWSVSEFWCEKRQGKRKSNNNGPYPERLSTMDHILEFNLNPWEIGESAEIYEVSSTKIISLGFYIAPKCLGIMRKLAFYRGLYSKNTLEGNPLSYHHHIKAVFTLKRRLGLL